MEEALWIRDAADTIAVCEIVEQGERQELVTGLLIELGENHEVSISNKLPVSLMLMCLSSDKGQKAPRPRSQKLALCCWLTAPLANSGKQIKTNLIKATKGKICVPCIFLSNWYFWDGKGELAGPPVCGTSIWGVCCMHVFMKPVLGADTSFFFSPLPHLNRDILQLVLIPARMVVVHLHVDGGEEELQSPLYCWQSAETENCLFPPKSSPTNSASIWTRCVQCTNLLSP